MFIQNFISSEIQPLTPQFSVQEALDSFEDQNEFHLPVVEAGKFLGLVSEDALLNADENLTVRDLSFDYLPVSVPEDEHLFVATGLLISRQLGLLPVINAEGNYLGSVLSDTMLQQTAIHCGLMEEGALIVMETDIIHFSISEISRLVETNNASIRQLNTLANTVTGTIMVTMRLNKREVSDVVATLQRYDYRIVYFTGDEHYENELRRNYNHLINFLSI